MNRKQILGILFGVSLLQCESQKTQNLLGTLGFNKIKSHYKKSEQLIYKIENKSDTLYEYYVGLESFFLDNWHELFIDIDTSAPFNGAVIIDILPDQIIEDSSSILTNSPNKNTIPVLSKSNPQKKKYRFILNYRAKKDTEFKSKKSDVFTVDE